MSNENAAHDNDIVNIALFSTRLRGAAILHPCRMRHDLAEITGHQELALAG
jgi:hypothetical protein